MQGRQDHLCRLLITRPAHRAHSDSLGAGTENSVIFLSSEFSIRAPIAAHTPTSLIPEAPAAGRLVTIKLSVAKGTLRIGRIAIMGSAISESLPGECVVQTSMPREITERHKLENLLSFREGVQPVRAAGTRIHDCSVSDVSTSPTVVEKGLDQGTPLTGVSIEARHGPTGPDSQPIEVTLRVLQQDRSSQQDEAPNREQSIA